MCVLSVVSRWKSGVIGAARVGDHGVGSRSDRCPGRSRAQLRQEDVPQAHLLSSLQRHALGSHPAGVHLRRWVRAKPLLRPSRCGRAARIHRTSRPSELDALVPFTARSMAQTSAAICLDLSCRHFSKLRIHVFRLVDGCFASVCDTFSIPRTLDSHGVEAAEDLQDISTPDIPNIPTWPCLEHGTTSCATQYSSWYPPERNTHIGARNSLGSTVRSRVHVGQRVSPSSGWSVCDPRRWWCRRTRARG